MMLSIEQVTVRYGNKTVVDKATLTLEAGQWLMLVGPNGAGKSTLISAITKGVPYEGRIALDGKDVRKIKPAQLARHIGVLSQQHHVGYDYTVAEIVGMGRYAHQRGFLSTVDDAGEKKIDEALCATGMQAFSNQSVLTLSGGEIQRAFLAQVFAQDPKILILDEPANHLDLVYQKHIFTLIEAWLKTPGRAVISVVHDLSLAKCYGTHAVLMDKGRCVASGETKRVLTPEALRAVYEMDVYQWMRQMLSQWE